MALPLLPLAILGAGGFMLFRGLRGGAVVSVAMKPAFQLASGQLALQAARFSGLVIAAQARGGLEALSPALGSPKGWAFQAVKRKSDSEKQLLFATSSGTPNFLVRGGFYTYYDKFMSTLGRPKTDEYRIRDPNYRGMGGRIIEIVRQDFQGGRMDWNPESKSVHVFDRSKRIGGWRRRRTSSYPWWDARSNFTRGAMKVTADLTAVAAIGVGGVICVGGSIVTGGAGAAELCKLGAKAAALTCDVNQGLQKFGEDWNQDNPPSSRLDYRDEGYIFDSKDVCDTTRVIDKIANSSGDDGAGGIPGGLAGFEGLQNLGLYIR